MKIETWIEITAIGDNDSAEFYGVIDILGVPRIGESVLIGEFALKVIGVVWSDDGETVECSFGHKQFPSRERANILIDGLKSKGWDRSD